MTPPPFVARYLIQWFATQTMQRAEQMVFDEVKNRVETGNLGDYDGLVFKDAFRSKNATERITVGNVDLGIVAATKGELVGILDKMGTPKATKGDAFKYYAGTWLGYRVAAVETGCGFESAKRGTEALIQAFRPSRVVCVGFARALDESLKPGSLFVPDRLMKEDGTILDLSQPCLPAPEKREVSAKETQEDATQDSVETLDSGTAASQPQGETETKNTDDLETKAEFVNTESPVFAFLKKFATGTLISVDREVVKKNERKRFAEEFGAKALDRETLAVAEVCGESGTPFLPLRAIFDLSSQAGSKEAERAVRSEGQSMARTLGALFGAVSKRPSAALDVYKLKEQSLEAADKLAKALGNILKMAQNA